jgi:protein-S-isoprenylcysteine O-methyltransferase Ste14
MLRVDPVWAKVAVLAAAVAMVVIRAPHGHRSGKVPVASRHRGPREAILLTIAWASFFVPAVWIASPWLAFADYALHVVPFVLGTLLLVLGLRLFHRSHADLGTNWSITLELREGHRLVTHGVYRRVRHPMYSSLVLYGVGQALVLPNWVAGPSYLVALGILVLLRLGPEEAMMREHFGAEYDAYAARTKRLVPGVW